MTAHDLSKFRVEDRLRAGIEILDSKSPTRALLLSAILLLDAKERVASSPFVRFIRLSPLESWRKCGSVCMHGMRDNGRVFLGRLYIRVPMRNAWHAVNESRECVFAITPNDKRGLDNVERVKGYQGNLALVKDRLLFELIHADSFSTIGEKFGNF